MAVLGFVIVGLAIATSSYYWVTRGRDQQYLLGRYMTAFAFVFWPLFLIYFAIAAASGKGQAGKAE